MATFEDILNEQGTLVYTNVGTSMMPLLRERRDLMIIRRYSHRLSRLDVPLFKRPDTGKYILHRVIWVKKDGYIVCGDNQWLPEHILESQVLGVLTAVNRDGGKMIDLSSNLKYKIYSHLWCDLYPIRAVIFLCRDIYKRVKRMITKH